MCDVAAQVDKLRWVPFLFKGDYSDFESGWYDDAGETILIQMAVHVVSATTHSGNIQATIRHVKTTST
jgi:hypothetical protein